MEAGHEITVGEILGKVRELNRVVSQLQMLPIHTSINKYALSKDDGKRLGLAVEKAKLKIWFEQNNIPLYHKNEREFHVILR